jgi:hypothetical protein
VNITRQDLALKTSTLEKFLFKITKREVVLQERFKLKCCSCCEHSFVLLVKSKNLLEVNFKNLIKSHDSQLGNSNPRIFVDHALIVINE